MYRGHGDDVTGDLCHDLPGSLLVESLVRLLRLTSFLAFVLLALGKHHTYCENQRKNKML